jgi:hypothetical protein
MGYRSDVEILFYPQDPEDFAMLKLYVDETLPDKFEVGGIPPRMNWPQGNKYLHLRLESVKWYPSYEDVIVYTECFDNWGERFGSPPKFHFEFVRIGEDDEDTETHYSNDAAYALQIERSITLSF